MNPNENTNPSFDIKLMQMELERELANNNYRKAQEINEQIQAMKAAQKAVISRSPTENDIKGFHKEKMQLRCFATKLQNEYTQKLFDIRTKFQRRYKMLIAKQNKESKTLTTNFSKTLEFETTRPVPETLHLLRQSELRSKLTEYAMADQLAKEAHTIQNSTIKERQNQVKTQFESQQDFLSQKQHNEIDNHIRKLKHHVNATYLEYNRRIDLLKRKYIIQASRYRITATEQDAEAFFSRYKLVDHPEINQVNGQYWDGQLLDQEVQEVQTMPNTNIKPQFDFQNDMNLNQTTTIVFGLEVYIEKIEFIDIKSYPSLIMYVGKNEPQTLLPYSKEVQPYECWSPRQLFQSIHIIDTFEHCATCPIIFELVSPIETTALGKCAFELKPLICDSIAVHGYSPIALQNSFMHDFERRDVAKLTVCIRTVLFRVCPKIAAIKLTQTQK